MNDEAQSSKQIAVGNDEDLTRYDPESPFLKAKKLLDRGLKSIQVRITDVSVSQYSDGKQQVTLHFKGKDGPLLFGLNKINRETVFAMFGTRKSDLIGNLVTIYTSKTQFNGQTVDCLRIDDRPAKQIEASAQPIANGSPAAPRRMAATAPNPSTHYKAHGTFASGNLTTQAVPAGQPDVDELSDNEVPF